MRQPIAASLFVLSAIACGKTAADDQVGASPSPTNGGVSGAAVANPSGGADSGGEQQQPAATAGEAGAEPGAIPSAAGAAGDSGGVGGSSDQVGWKGCGSAVFCDDFESYSDAPLSPWKPSNGGQITIDAARAVSGQKSVKFSTLHGQNSSASMGLSEVFPLASNAFYGRIRLWVSDMPASNSVHWNFFQATGPAMVALGGLSNNFLASYYSTETGDCWQHSKTPVPTRRWFCFEWHIDGANNAMESWLDEAPLADLNVDGKGEACQQGTNQWTFPSVSQVSIGWRSFGLDDARTIWADDFALDTERIGCGN